MADLRPDRWRTVALVLLSVATLLAVAVVATREDEPSLAERHTDAYFACQHFVEQELRAPSTAEFPRSDSPAVRVSGTNPFIVRSVVDAENAFGANIRTSWTCTAADIGDGWTADVTLDT